MDDVEAQLRLFADKSRVNVWRGSYVGLDDDPSGVLVDISNGDASGRVPAQVMTEYRPEVGEQVFVMTVDGPPFYLMGPTTPKPAQGTVTAVASDRVTLDSDVGSVQATIGQGMTLSVGQVVKLMWSDGAHVVGILSTPGAPPNPTPTPPPPPPPPAASTHVDVFTAVDAGSFSGGRWWQAQPWASDSTLGAWFYGTKIVDTLRSAPVSSIEIYISAVSRFGALPNVGVHNDAAKQPGGVAIANAVPMALTDGWYPLPANYGQFLANQVGGIGLAHGGFNKYRSLAQDAQSGALRITSTY